MSREFKFRVWDSKNKKMLAWSALIDNDGYYRPKYGIDMLSKEGADLFGWTVLLYSGLKDKNGIEMYEGDIVRGRSTDEYDYANQIIGTMPPQAFSNSVVKCGDGMTGWSPFSYFTGNGVNGLEDEFYELATCEVIGNVYQNPELLKNTEEGKQ